MANEVLSSEMVLRYNNLTIAKARSFTLEVNKEEIDITVLDDAEWKKIIAGGGSFSLSSDGLVARVSVTGQINFDELLEQLKADKESVQVVIRNGTEGEKAHKGNVIITGLNQSGSLGDVVTYSATLSGDGKPEQFDIDLTPPTNTTGYPSASGATSSGFTVNSNLNEAGKSYFVVLANGSAAPDSPEVKAGTDSAGGAPIKKGTIDIAAATTVYSQAVSGLTASTAYDVYVASEDVYGNLQAAPVKIDISTTV